MTTETAAKKDTQRLQRAIVDGLEDVKGQDIQVFNTEHLSPLFERVIIASGTSNRQTKALASSVRDAVKEAGFPKPRIEGEDNGEWIIVDCGAAVAHIMQPTIRQYYHLEEIWGDKPVRLKFGAPQPARAEPEAPAPRRKAAAKKAVEPTLRRSSAAKTAVKAAEAVARAEKAERAAPKRKPAAKTGARTPAKAPAAKTGAPATVKTVVVKAPVRAASRKPAPGTPAKKAVARKAPARKA